MAVVYAHRSLNEALFKHFLIHHLEKEMATHPCVGAWSIARKEEAVGLQSMGSQRVGHDCATFTHPSSSKRFQATSLRWSSFEMGP